MVNEDVRGRAALIGVFIFFSSAPTSASTFTLQKPVYSLSTRLTKWLYTIWSLRYAVLCAFALRMMVVAFCARGTVNPEHDYGSFGAEMGWVARSLALGHGFSSPFAPDTGPTALVPPLYPTVLAVIFHWFGVYSLGSAVVALTLQSLLSSLTCVPVALLSERIGGSRSRKPAAWAWALYPYAIHYSGAEVWDYALTGFLFSLALLLLLRRSSPLTRRVHTLLCGLLAGITVLSNPSVATALIGLAAYHAFLSSYRPRFLTYCVGVLLICSPWCVRNFNALHTMSPVRDGLWLEIWAGNHGDTFLCNPPLAHPATNPAEMLLYQNLGETLYMSQKRDQAVQYVENHPLSSVTLTFRRVLRFWSGFWSVDDAYLKQEPYDAANIPFCGTLTLLVVAGLVRIWKNQRYVAYPILLVLFVFPLPYYLSHASMDYRQPIEPLLVVVIVQAFQTHREENKVQAALHDKGALSLV